jgi:hypothetical protein
MEPRKFKLKGFLVKGREHGVNTIKLKILWQKYKQTETVTLCGEIKWHEYKGEYYRPYFSIVDEDNVDNIVYFTKVVTRIEKVLTFDTSLEELLTEKIDFDEYVFNGVEFVRVADKGKINFKYYVPQFNGNDVYYANVTASTEEEARKIANKRFPAKYKDKGYFQVNFLLNEDSKLKKMVAYGET